MTTVYDIDSDINHTHIRLQKEGVYRKDDPRKDLEPFKSFREARSALQSELLKKTDRDFQAIDANRKAANVAVPLVIAALTAVVPQPVVAGGTCQEEVPMPETAKEYATDAEIWGSMGAIRCSSLFPDEIDEIPPQAILPSCETAVQPTGGIDNADPSAFKPLIEEAEHVGFDIGGLLRVRIQDLKPNPININVFGKSLGEESIRPLAEDIKVRKLRYPIEVTSDLTTMDGERRRRSLVLLDPDGYTYVRVVSGIDSDEQVEGYIFDSFSSGRRADLLELANVYDLGVKVLGRRHGRPQGRPSEKDRRDDDLFWTPQQVKEEAAKRAGFSSEVTADRAVSAIRRADPELLAKLVSGEVTISAAYAQLGKPRVKNGADAGKGTEKPNTEPTPSELGKSDPVIDLSAAQEQEEGSNPLAEPSKALQGSASNESGWDGELTEMGGDRATDVNDDEPGDTGPDVAVVEALVCSSPVALPKEDTSPPKPPVATSLPEQVRPEPTPIQAVRATISNSRAQAMATLISIVTSNPADAAEIIQEIAEAAEVDVLVWDAEADAEQVEHEVSSLLVRKIEKLAEIDYELAYRRVESISEDLSNAVDAYAPIEDEDD